ncbi:glycoside hydrolase family 26 protein [Nocardioides sp.]|uniref:glycoside hydrolase family 26 protein n=1 Tax=Nocardioides sp. TaxID=35761 RepID=UPI0027323B1F|nr:glycosyl hydrolase [Nocardioides sp.]MDP3890040.1 glycosyl hydrolase [Nocardioides sp.]
MSQRHPDRKHHLLGHHPGHHHQTRHHLGRREVFGLAAATAAGVALGAAGLERSMTTATAASRPRVLFGAWVPGSTAAWDEVEHKLDRRLDIEHWYQGWGVEENGFDLDRARAVRARGGIPMVTWEPWDYRRGRNQPAYRLKRIVAGRFDAYIRANARQMAAVNGPVWLRFAHEMNGRAYPWSIGVNGNSGRDYIRAWRRIVRIFRAQGATNVRFIWCPLVPGPGTSPIKRSFPGDKHIHYVGMDGYNAGREADWGGWLSFDEVFRPLYRQLRRMSRRKVIIAETGCAERGGNKATWISSAFGRRLAKHYPAVRAVVWFNEPREADWRMESSSASLTAARRAFSSGPFA